VPGNVTISDGGEAEDDAGRQPRSGQQPEQVEEITGARLAGVEERQPEGRERDHQAEHHQHAPGTTVPARPAAPDPGGELERAEDSEADRGDDVQDDGYG